MSEAVRLTTLRKAAIGMGDFGCNLYWQVSQMFLLYFYTDVVGLPAVTAGLVYMAALIWDGATDPVMGLIADRTRSRWGRYRPYLIFGGVPLALGFVAVFLTPAAGVAGAFVLALGAQFVFRSFYTIVSIPYASLFARITSDSAERGDLAGFRMVFGALAAITVAALTLPLAQGFGAESPRHGWVVVAGIYGVLSVLSLLLAAWGAQGLDKVETTREPRPPLRDVLRSVASNRALLLVLAAIVVSSFSTTMFGKNLLYYFKYVVGQENLGGAALTVTALVLVMAVPVWTVLLRVIGKKSAWIIGSVIGAIGLIGWRLADGHDLSLLFVALAVQAVGMAAGVVCFWSMLPDTVEYGEWRSGVRTESLVFGLTVLAQKVALGLGAGTLGVLLTHVGYVPNVAQSPQTLADLKAMMLWLPLGGTLTAAALIVFYPISRQTHARMVAEIAARKLEIPK